MGPIEALGVGLKWILDRLAELTGSAGVAIILLTLFIRFALYPLTLSQARMSETMKKLQPKMKELQQKYKDKPQEYQRRMMDLYKEYKVNPLAGCLPMLVQLPFLWALFTVLRQLPAETPFLIWDLGQKDPYYVLPALSGLTTYFQMSQTMTDPSQRTMMLVFPIMIGWISIGFPAGLVLYWVVSNLFSIGQQYMIAKQTAVPQGGARGQ